MTAYGHQRIPGKIDPIAVQTTGGVTDSFNRTNSTTTLGTTDGTRGGDPATWLTSGSSVWGINTNQAYCTTNTAHQTAVVETNMSDVTVSCKVSAFGAVNQGMVFRFQDASNFLWVLCQSGQVYYCRFVAGSQTNVTNVAGYTAGDTISVTAVGTAINIYRNGVNIISQTDSTFQTATKHGLINNSSGSTARYDDFSVVVAP